jgi:putative transposase
MEDLNIKGMFKNKRWAPKLQKISLYKLVQMIKYKSKWYEKTFIQIDRFYPSSQICSECGYQKHDLTIDIREWTCPSCKTKHNRDVNAAKNILKKALQEL